MEDIEVPFANQGHPLKIQSKLEGLIENILVVTRLIGPQQGKLNVKVYSNVIFGGI